MSRRPDRIAVKTSSGEFDRFSRVTVVNDILSATEANFEIGDDGCWSELEQLVRPGEEFSVTLNGRPRLKGRAEVNTVPGDAARGVVLQLTIRTRTSDARYRSAPPGVKVEKTSIKDFILACYEPLGFAEPDFVFAPFVARDLLTGKDKGGAEPINFEAIQVDQAKVNPPETIHQAVERHLKRYGATQWDAPDGRIIIGAPDDSQAPLYRLICKRGPDSRGNNILSWNHIRDWTDVPQEVHVYGATSGRDITKSSVKGVAIDGDVYEVSTRTGHFNRLVVIPNQQAKDLAQAERMAQRELSARIRRKDAFEITVDGWTYWDGNEQIPWANNTTADVVIDPLGGPKGRYLIVRTDLAMGNDTGIQTRLSLVAPGIWVI